MMCDRNELYEILEIVGRYMELTQTFAHDDISHMVIPTVEDPILQRKLDDLAISSSGEDTCMVIFDVITYIESELYDGE